MGKALSATAGAPPSRGRGPRLGAAALAALVFLAGCGREPAAATVALRVGGHALRAELAVTEEQHRRGLSGRRTLAPDHGMLFVYEAEHARSFWMKDTHVPLSIAFLRADGTILNIEPMAPQTLTPHHSRGLAQYALEMRQGWFAERGIRPGDKVLLPPEVTRRR